MSRVEVDTRTLRYLDLRQEHVLPNEVVVTSCDSTEARGRNALWREIANNDASKVIWVKQISREQVEICHGTRQFEVNLRSQDEIAEILSGISYLVDVSGLSHCVWAPLLRSLFQRGVSTRVLYAEPRSYKSHPSPASSSVFDLSVTVEGVAPLPGFANLTDPPDENKCIFVALLGFEGNRPERLLLDIEPPPKVIPIIGAPGFRMEYPAFTVGCNRNFLTSYTRSSELRLARASCPFEVIRELEDVRKNYPDYYLYIALVGTKPHALGAAIFALANPDNTEILFDHPVRKQGRTDGIELIHIYQFQNFDDFRI